MAKYKREREREICLAQLMAEIFHLQIYRVYLNVDVTGRTTSNQSQDRLLHAFGNLEF